MEEMKVEVIEQEQEQEGATMIEYALSAERNNFYKFRSRLVAACSMV
jgi:hypothetical protein